LFLSDSDPMEDHPGPREKSSKESHAPDGFWRGRVGTKEETVVEVDKGVDAREAASNADVEDGAVDNLDAVVTAGADEVTANIDEVVDVGETDWAVEAVETVETDDTEGDAAAVSDTEESVVKGEMMEVGRVEEFKDGPTLDDAARETLKSLIVEVIEDRPSKDDEEPSFRSWESEAT
jgi:hypothetical protein